MLGMAPGTEGYAALLHEIGHALGLRHPRNVDPGDAWAMQLRAQDDRTALSVMSQSPSGDGLFRSDWGPLDVLALRYLYGTKAAATGDTHYALGALQGGSQTTIVDDGGVDTLDASALSTGVSLDLTPGHLGSAGITPAGFSGVDNLGVSASTLIEHAVGSPFDDVLLGNDIDNTLRGGLGNDWIEGGAGTDTAAFEGRRADYEVSNQFGKVFVKARDGVSGFDTLIDIEHLHFSDQTVVLSPKVLGNDSPLGVDEDASLAATLPDPADVARVRPSATSWPARRRMATPSSAARASCSTRPRRTTMGSTRWPTTSSAAQAATGTWSSSRCCPSTTPRRCHAPAAFSPWATTCCKGVCRRPATSMATPSPIRWPPSRAMETWRWRPMAVSSTRRAAASAATIRSASR